MDYYQKKEKEVNELRKRGTNKKNITYIGKDSHRRVTYHKRGKSPVLMVC
jgi:hypothetical protein